MYSLRLVRLDPIKPDSRGPAGAVSAMLAGWRAGLRPAGAAVAGGGFGKRCRYPMQQSAAGGPGSNNGGRRASAGGEEGEVGGEVVERRRMGVARSHPRRFAPRPLPPRAGEVKKVVDSPPPFVGVGASRPPRP
jgi:hypothetical protein